MTPPSPPTRDAAARIAEVFHRYDPPLWLVTSAADDRRGGLIATFVVRASIVTEIPRVVIGLAKQHNTWSLIEASDSFTLHLLPRNRLDLVWRFGLQSGKRIDKLIGLETRTSQQGNPIVLGAAAWLDCRVEERMDSGDRTIYLAEVLDGHNGSETNELLTVDSLLADAPPGRRGELEALYRRDGGIDQHAILAWRRDRTRGA